MATKRKVRLFRAGDRVYVLVGGRRVKATVTEDRGHIGASGGQLVRVSVPVDPTYVSEFEVPAEEIERVNASA